MNVEPINNLNEELEKYATSILVQYDELKVPVDVTKIAEELGIQLLEKKLKKEISGAIRFNKDTEQYEILVNAESTYQHKRFTIAHELGHYFFHREMLKDDKVHIDTLYMNSENKMEEEKMDYFASALLVNNILLRKCLGKVNYVSDLAKMFDVSESVMLLRLDILGYLNND